MAVPDHNTAGPESAPDNKRVGSRGFRSAAALEHRKDDLLGRAAFATALARGLLAWKEQESLVVALTGEWGTGKSSVKNFVLEELAEAAEEVRPDVLEFNPWLWSGHESVGNAFLREVGTALGSQKEEEQNKRIAAAWKSYAARLVAGAYFAETIGLATVQLGLAVSIGAIIAAEVVPHFKIVGVSIAIASLVLTLVLRRGGKLAELIASSFDARAKLAQQTTAEARETLKVELGKRQRPLLIVMDDVDRLSAREIALVFQLVKASADLPNIIYFLLYQRDLVERSLEQVAPNSGAGHGRAFLEKIVQVSFTIPKLDRNRLESIITTGLNEILADPAMDRHFDQSRWTRIYLNIVRSYLGNVRDVHRFLNTLDFHAGVFRGPDSLEVNPIDLIAIEVIRVFEPDVYSRIANLKGLLTGDDISIRLEDKPSEENKSLIRAVIEAAREERKDQVRSLLFQLFPRSRPFLGEGATTDDDDTWLRDLRVCHPDVFDRYFHFAILEGDLSRAELDRLLALTGDADAFAKALNALNDRHLLVTAIDRLESFKLEIPADNSGAVAEALFNVGDLLPDTELRFAMSPDQLAARIIHFTVRRLPTGAARKEHLARAFARATRMGLSIFYLTWLDPGRREKSERSEQILSAAEFDEIKAIAMARLTQPEVRSVLASERRLGWILYRWSEYAGNTAARAYVAELTRTPEGALQFVTAMTRRVTSSGMERFSIPTVTWDIDRKDLTTFIDIPSLATQLAALDESKLDTRERNAVQAFKRVLSGNSDLAE